MNNNVIKLTIKENTMVEFIKYLSDDSTVGIPFYLNGGEHILNMNEDYEYGFGRTPKCKGKSNLLSVDLSEYKGSKIYDSMFDGCTSIKTIIIPNRI